jgi:hypothetical protein
VTLDIDLDLPSGALIDRADDEFLAALAGSDAVWLQARDADVDTDSDGALTAWRARHGDVVARPTTPNRGHARLGDIDGHRGLQCIAETNCGFVLDRIANRASRFSMAVIYLPSETAEARTLLTVNAGFSRGKGGDGGGYLFLSEADGLLTVKDTAGAVALSHEVPARPGRPRLALVTLDGRRLALFCPEFGLATTEGAMPPLNSAADLFIGCRSHRRGLQKTLGGAVIRDVLFWPGGRLSMPRGPEDDAPRVALERYFRWTG